MRYFNKAILIGPLYLASASLAFSATHMNGAGISHPEVSSEFDVTMVPDPVVTGVAVLPSQIDEWKKRKEKYEECGLCGDMQPFPE